MDNKPTIEQMKKALLRNENRKWMMAKIKERSLSPTQKASIESVAEMKKNPYTIEEQRAQSERMRNG